MATPHPPNLLELTLPALETLFRDLGEKPFRAKQLFQWLWAKDARDFDAMTNLAKGLRAALAEAATIHAPRVVHDAIAADGTVKLLLSLADDARVEAVLIPEKDHYTLCCSTQVGCAMGCRFCATGTLGFTRHMTGGEIAGQVLAARRFLAETRDERIVRAASGGGAAPLPLRNLVYMGMGEPLNNLAHTLASLELVTHPLGLDHSPRRITVSTVGVPGEAMQRLGETGLASLAVSLHAPTQALRQELMPRAAKALPLSRLMEACQDYPLRPRQRITFEYVLLGGVNDQPAHARELARLLSNFRGSRPKLNLIAYNPSFMTGDAPFTAPTTEAVTAFQDILRAKDFTAMLRKSKGQDIAAACGQLVAGHSLS